MQNSRGTTVENKRKQSSIQSSKVQEQMSQMLHKYKAMTESIRMPVQSYNQC